MIYSTKQTASFLLWLSSVVFYVLGVYFPLLTTRSQLLGITITKQDIRLFDSISLFYNSNEIVLAGIIFIFTVALPVGKYFEMIIRILKPNAIGDKYSKWFHALDKWSMLDVFVVALLILNFKLNSSIIVMKIMPGTTFLAVSILLRMAAVHSINK